MYVDKYTCANIFNWFMFQIFIGEVHNKEINAIIGISLLQFLSLRLF